jgi:hypothetical protein
VSGDARSIYGGKLIATTLHAETDKNRATDLVAVPCEGGYVGPLSPFFVLFSQPAPHASVLKSIKMSNTSGLLNKSILIFLCSSSSSFVYLFDNKLALDLTLLSNEEVEATLATPELYEIEREE